MHITVIGRSLIYVPQQYIIMYFIRMTIQANNFNMQFGVVSFNAFNTSNYQLTVLMMFHNNALFYVVYCITIGIVLSSKFPETKGRVFQFERSFLNAKYRLLWNVEPPLFKALIQAKTTGWLGLGFAPTSSGMHNADIIIGYVKDGKVTIEDCIVGNGNSAPVRDVEQKGSVNIMDFDGWEANGWTNIAFTRYLESNDSKDVNISTTDVNHAILAFGETDDISKIHAKSARTSTKFLTHSELTKFSKGSSYRSIDGFGNNVANPKWGSVGDTYLRKSGVKYQNGIDSPSNVGRPLPRVISNRLFGRPNRLQPLALSSMVTYYGQFLAHDISMTTSSKHLYDKMPITIPKCDPIFDIMCKGPLNMSFTRSAWDPSTGTNSSNPRQQTNSQTAFLDASMVYGQTVERAKALRVGQNGCKLILDYNNLLPEGPNITMACEQQCPHLKMRKAGDARANENSMLFSLHTVFAREHNRWCGILASAEPSWSNEVLYQEARRRVIALWQKFTVYEYLPVVFGEPPKLWEKYNKDIVPQVSHEFNVCAFRYGHSEVSKTIPRINSNGEHSLSDDIIFRENLFRGHVGLVNESIEPLLRGICQQRPGKVDLVFVDDIRNYLFGLPAGTLGGATDLASRSIQRSREHGIPSYNEVRVAYGLTKMTKWDQVSSDPEEQKILKSLYKSVNDLDLFVGGLAEDHNGTTIVGELYTKIIEDDFNRIRDGDRYWFENNQFTQEELKEIMDTRFSEVIRRNSNFGDFGIPNNVFYLDPAYTQFRRAKDFDAPDGFPHSHGRFFENSHIAMRNYKVLWNARRMKITFMLMVKTTGWVGIGFEPDQRGLMVGADMIIARVLKGGVEVKDYKAIFNVGKPVEDTAKGGSNDVRNIDGWEVKGWTIVTFERNRYTNDTDMDKEIPHGKPTYTLFAYQEETDAFQYHGPNVIGKSIDFSHPKPHVVKLLSENSNVMSGIVFGGIGIFLTLSCLFFQTKYRHIEIVQHSSPRVSLALLFGSILVYGTIPLFAVSSLDVCDESAVMYDTKNSIPKLPSAPCGTAHTVCNLCAINLSIGFTLVFGCIFVKTCRVYKIFCNSKMKKVKITNNELLRNLFSLVLLDAIIIFLLEIANPISKKHKWGLVQEQPNEIIHVVDEFCSVHSSWGVLVAVKGIELILCMFMVFVTRYVPLKGMNDFKSVALSTYNIGIVCIFTLPLLMLVRDNPTLKFWLGTLAIFLSLTMLLILMYVPKMKIAMNSPQAKFAVTAETSTTGS